MANHILDIIKIYRYYTYILWKGKEMTNEQFEERAAIMEYDGNLIREEAERLAREDELRQIQEKNNQSA